MQRVWENILGRKLSNLFPRFRFILLSLSLFLNFIFEMFIYSVAIEMRWLRGWRGIREGRNKRNK